MAYRRHTARGTPVQGTSRTQTSDAAATPTEQASEHSLRKRTRRARLQFHWSDAISRSEWAIYRSAMRAVREAGIPFMLGGGFAGATFTGRWRDTKDIDFYVHPRDRQATIAALTA